MAYVVDVLFFKHKKQTRIVKEMATASVEENIEKAKVFLFKPPFCWSKLSRKYRRENIFLELYNHGLTWDSGEIEFHSVGSVLKSTLQNAKIIYVNHYTVKQWLENFNFDFVIVDISELGYENDSFSTTDCDHHNGAYRSTCALHNVEKMKVFVEEIQDRKRKKVEEELTEDVVG